MILLKDVGSCKNVVYLTRVDAVPLELKWKGFWPKFPPEFRHRGELKRCVQELPASDGAVFTGRAGGNSIYDSC